MDSTLSIIWITAYLKLEVSVALRLDLAANTRDKNSPRVSGKPLLLSYHCAHVVWFTLLPVISSDLISNKSSAMIRRSDVSYLISICFPHVSELFQGLGRGSRRLSDSSDTRARIKSCKLRTIPPMTRLLQWNDGHPLISGARSYQKYLSLRSL